MNQLRPSTDQQYTYHTESLAQKFTRGRIFQNKMLTSRQRHVNVCKSTVY